MKLPTSGVTIVIGAVILLVVLCIGVDLILSYAAVGGALTTTRSQFVLATGYCSETTDRLGLNDGEVPTGVIPAVAFDPANALVPPPRFSQPKPLCPPSHVIAEFAMLRERYMRSESQRFLM